MAKRDLPPELSAALRLAWALAARLGHACVGTEHLLLALAMQPQGADGRLLHWAGLTGPEIAAAVLRLHGRGAPSDVLPQGLTQAARRAVSRALNGPVFCTLIVGKAFHRMYFCFRFVSIQNRFILIPDRRLNRISRHHFHQYKMILIVLIQREQLQNSIQQLHCTDSVCTYNSFSCTDRWKIRIGKYNLISMSHFIQHL